MDAVAKAKKFLLPTVYKPYDPKLGKDIKFKKIDSKTMAISCFTTVSSKIFY
jgi:hypothetical protein